LLNQPDQNKTALNISTPPSNRDTQFAVQLLWLTPVFMMALLAVACNQISERMLDHRMDTGIIEYSISFPEVTEESITASLLPDRMTYAFSQNSFASNFETAGGVFKNRIVADQSTKTLEHQLKIFRKKIKVKMNETDVNKMLSAYPKMTVIKTDDIDTIAGYRCQKALIIFEEVGMAEIEVYYTNEINMTSPNWCTQYHEIEGVLMAYEIEEFGIRMRLQAISVTAKPVEEDLNPGEEEYSTISREMMDIELAQLVETFEL